jgi:large subunit ribosomal protein L22
MKVQALKRKFRMSPQKVREVVRQIQGMNALEALNILRFVPRKSARAVAQTLKSALANAENNHGLRPEKLIIERAAAETAGSFKRFVPKARGSAGPILKRSCHIRIILTEVADVNSESK